MDPIPLSLKDAERLALEALPPVALEVFAERMGKHPDTLRKWKNMGLLEFTNILGKNYITGESAVLFCRRAKRGDFARDIKPDPAVGAAALAARRGRRKDGRV